MERNTNIVNVQNVCGVECYEKDGTAYLKLESVARGLGFTQEKNGVEYVRWDRLGNYLREIGFPSCGENDFIPENIFYRLAMKAKNETAEKFQALVADEIIPSIRKHGIYATDNVIDEILNNPDFGIHLLTKLKEERQARLLAEQKIEEQKPLVAFANKVSVSTNLIDMKTMAKLLKDEEINIGRNRLFEWLRNKKILMKDNMPYQKYVDDGLFQVKEYTYKTAYGVKTQQITYVTGKGQIYITERLRKEWASCNAEKCSANFAL